MRLTPRDILTFEVIQRHWWLPSHYLHEFTKHLGSDMFRHRKALARLVQEGYLERPLALNNPLVKNDFLNYALTPKSIEVLEAMGKRHKYAVPPGGGYAHAAMTIAVTANIELQATKAGYTFISQEEILPAAPKATRDSRTPLALPSSISYTFKGRLHKSDRPTIPDQLFGIDYGTGYRFFAVEADRGTETIEPTKGFKVNSILRKLLAYNEILKKGEYRTLLGIPVLYPLFVTTSRTRAENMAALAFKEFGKSNLMLFGDVPGFAPFFRSPPLLPKLWDEAWLRSGNEPFRINAA